VELQNQVLAKLSEEQVSEALSCLYHDRNPQDKVLQNLQAQEWGFLYIVLLGLMRERKQASLH